jgi:hypothetical protein
MQVPWRQISVLFILLCVFVLPTENTHAQLSEGQPIGLSVEPQYPSPHSSVIISLEAYSMDTTGATIRWYIDKVEQVSARNERGIEVQTKALGQKQVVTAEITLPNNFTFNVTRDIIPSEVDIILESSAYTPAFYKGRALPGGNSIVRVIAIPHTTSNSPANAFTYEWKQGETVLFGGPVKGKYTADVLMSRYDDDYITVRVTNSTGAIVGGKAILLKPVEPELHFYEENPLRGLSSRAITDSLYLIGEETTIHAEPFYMATDLSRRTINFEWQINGGEATPGEDSHTITLRRTNEGGGSVRIDVTALTTTAIPQYVQRGMSIIF